jgi:hypothetical protein
MDRIFMKKRAMNNLATVFMVVALLFVGHTGASALVLCVGLDGHVDVEASSADVCTTQGAAVKAGDRGHDPRCLGKERDDHCGSCVDFPIVVGGMDRCHPMAQVSKTNVQAPVITLAILPDSILASSDAAGFVRLAPMPTPFSLLSTRAVSLRI